MLDELIHRRLRVPYTLNAVELNAPKNPRMTLVLFHGIGSSTNMWRQVVAELPLDVRVVAIDLLGFGKSPKPGWANYDVGTQMKSVIKTMALMRVPRGSVLVGHSLGALVVTEVAKTIPSYASELVLISPPIYRPSRKKVVATQREDILRGIYKILHNNPKNAERALLFARKLYAKRQGINMSANLNIDSFLATLKAAIVNQVAIDHISTLNLPITIMTGSIDPLVIEKIFEKIAQDNPNITHISVKRAGHNVVGLMHDAVVERLRWITRPEPAIDNQIRYTESND